MKLADKEDGSEIDTRQCDDAGETSSTGVTTGYQRQRRGFSGPGLRSLSLHSCAAFISSLAALGLGNNTNIDLQHAISHSKYRFLHTTQ